MEKKTSLAQDGEPSSCFTTLTQHMWLKGAPTEARYIPSRSRSLSTMMYASHMSEADGREMTQQIIPWSVSGKARSQKYGPSGDALGW